MLALVTAIITGFGLSYFSLDRGWLFGTMTIGPWVAWPEVGSPEPDPYTRAYIARSGALHLARAEGLRFTARTDSDGAALDLNCNYRIAGSTPVAAFWTLTAMDSDGTLVTPPGMDHAIHSARVARAEDGSTTLHVGPGISAGNWLEVQGEGNFELVLTIYDSSVFSGIGAFENTLPSITQERCR